MKTSDGISATPSLSAPPRFRAEQIALDIEGHTVQVWRAAELERFVDVQALLRDDAPPEPPYWMHLWPGAVAAARLVARSEIVCPGTRVLELGCGLGLPALLAAQRGAAVLASDRELAPFEFVRRSAAANRCRLECVQMDWSAPALRGRFDLCIGADIGYDAAVEAALVESLAALVAVGGAVWLADSVNTARDSLAARLAGQGFVVEMETMREWEDGHAVWVRVIRARRSSAASATRCSSG